MMIFTKNINHKMRKSDKLKSIEKANILAEQRFIETTNVVERIAPAKNNINDILNDNPFIKPYINEILKTLETNGIHKSNVKNVLTQIIEKHIS
jgi:hypothetical protein